VVDHRAEQFSICALGHSQKEVLWLSQTGPLSCPWVMKTRWRACKRAQNDAMAAKSPAMVKALLSRADRPCGVYPRACLRARGSVRVRSHCRGGQRRHRQGGAHSLDHRTQRRRSGRWHWQVARPGDCGTLTSASTTTNAGPFLLALGITSIRDPGNYTRFTTDRASRRAAHQLLLPHVYPSLLVDGKGPYTAQVGDGRDLAG
jgi:hypothetical protein